MTEEMLLTQAQAGDRAALGELLILHERSCYALALKLTGNEADAQDVCQDAFSRAVRGMGSWKPVGSFKAWLLSIVLCAHRDRLDSESARKRREGSYAVDRTHQEWTDAGISGLQRAELRKRMDASLDTLDEKYRLPILLHYEQGLSHADVALALQWPENTVATNIRRGLEELRGLMARAGYTCAVPAVTAALAEASVVSVPASLTAFIKTLATSGAVKTAAGTGAAAATTTAIPLSLKVAAGVLIAAAVGIAGYEVGRPRPPVTDPPRVAEPTPVAAEAPLPKANLDFTITSLTNDSWYAFEEIERRGGPKVWLPGGGTHLMTPWNCKYVPAPETLCFRPVGVREFIEGVVATSNSKVLWSTGYRYALIYEGKEPPTDEELQRIKVDLASPDITTRINALKRAGMDLRLVPLLVKAARDPDAEWAKKALGWLRNIGWEIVLAEDVSARDLVEADLAAKDSWLRLKAAYALVALRDERAHDVVERARAIAEQEFPKPGRPNVGALFVLLNIGDEKALATIRNALSFPKESSRFVSQYASYVLMKAGAVKTWDNAYDDRGLDFLCRESDLPLLESALGSTAARARRYAVNSLGRIGGEKAESLAEKALADADATVRAAALFAITRIRGEKALPLLEDALENRGVQGCIITATNALGWLGNEKALALLDKALTYDQADVRLAAASRLLHVDAPKAVATLDQLGKHPDIATRKAVVRILSGLTGELAQQLAEKCLSSSFADVRFGALSKLKKLRDAKAQTLLEKAVNLCGKDPDAAVRAAAVLALGNLKTKSLIEKAVDVAGNDPDPSVRAAVVLALDDAEVSPDALQWKKAWERLEQAILTPDFRGRTDLPTNGGGTSGPPNWQDVRQDLGNAVSNPTHKYLGRTGTVYMLAALKREPNIDRAMKLLEQLVEGKDLEVRRIVAHALALGGKKGLKGLEQLARDGDWVVRHSMYNSLGLIGDEKARDVLLRSLTIEKELLRQSVRFGADTSIRKLVETLREKYKGDPAVEEALRDSALPGERNNFYGRGGLTPEPKPAPKVDEEVF